MKVFGFVVVCLLLSSGCTSDAPDEPKVEAEADTPSAPHLRPPLLRRSSSSARLSSPASSSRAGSTPRTRTFVKRTIERAYEYFEVPHSGKPEMRYAEVYGKGSPYASEDQLCGRRTDAGGIQIYLEACSDLGRTELVTTIVHEVFHAMQDFTRDTYRRGPDIVIGGLYPNWYEEGSAVWAAARVLDEWNVRGYRRSQFVLLGSGTRRPETLRQLENYNQWRKGDVFGHYSMGFLGVERALDGQGVENRARGLRTRLVTPGPSLGQGFQGDVRDLDEAFLQRVRPVPGRRLHTMKPSDDFRQRPGVFTRRHRLEGGNHARLG